MSSSIHWNYQASSQPLAWHITQWGTENSERAHSLHESHVRDRSGRRSHLIGRVTAENDLPQWLHEVGAGDTQGFAVGPQQPRVAADQQPQRCNRRVSGLQAPCARDVSASARGAEGAPQLFVRRLILM